MEEKNELALAESSSSSSSSSDKDHSTKWQPKDSIPEQAEEHMSENEIVIKEELVKMEDE